MKYMLLLRHAPDAGPAEGTPEFDAEMATWGELMGELGGSGVLIAAHGLDTEATATTVRIRDGETVSPTAPSPRPRSRSSATSSSTSPTSTPRSAGPSGCRTPPTGPSRSAPCPPTSRTPEPLGAGARPTSPPPTGPSSGRTARSGPRSSRRSPARWAATSASPRRSSPMPSPPRRRSGPTQGVPEPARRLAHHRRPAPGHRPPPPRPHPRANQAALDHLERLVRDENDTPTGDDHGHDRSSVADDRLRLLFTCCHPALALEARVALTLRAVGGLEVAEVARAFLTTETTMYQRLVRAKRKVKAAGIPYRVPARRRAARAARRRAARGAPRVHRGPRGHRRRRAGPGRPVRGGDPARPARRRAAARAEPEAHGLLALLLLTDARRPARTDADGTARQPRGPGPVSLGPRRHRRGHRRARPRARARAAGPVPGAGGGGRAPRRGADVGRHRLAADRRALRRARAARTVAGRHDQPGRGARVRRRAPRRPGRARGRSTATNGSIATSPCTPPAPSSSPEPATSTAAAAAYRRAIDLSQNPAEQQALAARAARWGCSAVE